MQINTQVAGTTCNFLAYLTGAAVFYLAARGKRLATEGIGYVALAGLVGGVMGAKLAEWVLAHGAVMAAHPAAVLDPRFGGRTIIGGLLGGWLAVEVAKRHLGIRRSTGDLFALALPAGETVGRIGCYFNGCCFGTPTNVPWAIYQHGQWRHPSQLYSAAAAAITFAVVLAMRQRMRSEGELFRLYLGLYGLSRFVIEFFRDRHLSFAGLSMAQWVCLEMLVAAVVALAFARAKPLPTFQPLPD